MLSDMGLPEREMDEVSEINKLGTELAPCFSIHSHAAISSTRKPCTCSHASSGGTAVFNYSPVRRTISVPPINVQAFVFKPAMHIYCSHASRGSLAAVMNDGLPKYKDRPKEQGGSGVYI